MNQDNAVAEALERLAAKAVKTADDIRYYSGGSKHNSDAEELAHFVMSNLPTIIAALKAQRVDEGGVS